MLDLSDGLGGDAQHLAAASGVALEVISDAAGRARGACRGAAIWTDPARFAAEGGEDYELLVALPPRSGFGTPRSYARVRRATHADRPGARRRGRPLHAARPRDRGGGFDHFR